MPGFYSCPVSAPSDPMGVKEIGFGPGQIWPETFIGKFTIYLLIFIKPRYDSILRNAWCKPISERDYSGGEFFLYS